jgi:hypothetical protein
MAISLGTQTPSSLLHTADNRDGSYRQLLPDVWHEQREEGWENVDTHTHWPREKAVHGNEEGQSTHSMSS